MSTLRTNAILDASGGNTATINGIPLRQGVLDPENRIINGSFDFWQRGTSSSASGYVAADRWSNSFFGGTVTMSRQSFTVGDTLGSNSPTFFMRHSVSGQSTSGQYGSVFQPIEGVRSYAGQTITVLGWARRSSGTGNMAVEGIQSFGSGGSPSPTVFGISPATVTLTGSWAPFAVPMTIPSIAGKTLGSNNNDFFALNFWTSAGSDFNSRTNSLGLQTIGVDLWGIHIKLGTHTADATALYKQPELGPELARCQRYFYKNLAVQDAPANGVYADNRVTIGTIFNNTDLQCAPIGFPTVMRTNPAITFYNPSFVTTAGRWGAYPMVWGTGFTPTVVTATPNYLVAGGNGISGGSNYASYIVSGYFAADAEL